MDLLQEWRPDLERLGLTKTTGPNSPEKQGFEYQNQDSFSQQSVKPGHDHYRNLSARGGAIGGLSPSLANTPGAKRSV